MSRFTRTRATAAPAGGVSAEHREHVTTWWCEVLGGPADYTQRLGGSPAMLAHHRDLGITPEQRFRFASLMSLASSRPRSPALAPLVGQRPAGYGDECPSSACGYQGEDDAAAQREHEDERGA